MALNHGDPSHLLNPNYKTDITRWLAEDCPSFDYGGFVVGNDVKEAKLLGKSSGILAGVPFFNEVFRQLDCTVQWHLSEGTPIQAPPSSHVATVRGPVRNLLLGERVALNILARCSGIATKSARLKAKLTSSFSSSLSSTTTTTPHRKPPILAGTRKTTPGFRLVEKYGMLIGGCDPHRYDLSAMTMLKDNHVWACNGSITKAVHAAKAVGGFAVKVEVECQSYDEAAEAIDAGADVVMLDNFDGPGVQACAQKLRARFGPGRFLIEVSGGVTEENIGSFAIAEEVDVISTSSIHQGVGHVDFSLKIVH